MSDNNICDLRAQAEQLAQELAKEVEATLGLGHPDRERLCHALSPQLVLPHLQIAAGIPVRNSG